MQWFSKMELNNLLISNGVAAEQLYGESLPELFTNPFSYAPHPLVEIAAGKVIDFLDLGTTPYLRNALRRDGKMFGVLIVQKPDGEAGYLAAYSGTHEDLKETGFFVPPVYDLISPDSFFPAAESEVNNLNDLIRDLEQDRYRFIHIEVTEEIRQCHLEEIAKLKDEYAKSKILRDVRRKEILDIIACGGDSAELQAELDAMDVAQTDEEKAAAYDRAEDELGDFLFATVNAARLYGLNPDTALERTCAKFRRRFTYLEENTIRQGRDLKSMTLAEMDAIWDEGKAKGL